MVTGGTSSTEILMRRNDEAQISDRVTTRE
jgi:hypothetical protein